MTEHEGIRDVKGKDKKVCVRVEGKCGKTDERAKPNEARPH